ncbi:MAG: DNA topoisomerase I [Euryarchaeota archaeon]|nr:DNA topoisomerase I [Euryarchaeota archaeon]MDE1837619.1 DNA topoisomerase I [Euryarchaeota archaeon]MDE1880811.1 DNA topoisomerase I [Euryarchaeota archaeon]MDE2045950.1 DNA topoisomerase I [Thermoplasmata archaeon]
MRTLVTTEKFSTALRIAVVLSDGKMERERRGPVGIFRFHRDDGEWEVVGLRGHIVELDYSKDLATWDLATLPKLLEATPHRSVTEQAIVEALRSLAPRCDRVILATDWDREGEVIAAECLEILHDVNPHLAVKRAQYSALTRSEIEGSFANLKELDRNLADAGLARQHVDLMWGALLTRYLTLTSQGGGGRGAGSQGGGFLSVGRVQTPTLALLVERDQEIKNFVPQPYWNLYADGKKNDTTFRMQHTHGAFFDRPEVEKLLERLQKEREAKVSSFKEEERALRPPVPFNTTLFVAEATKIGFGASQAMRVAEDLYTSGIISYPRTDNTVYPHTLGIRGIVEKLQAGAFEKEATLCLSQEKMRPTRGRTETTDHPPIYPTAAADPKKLRGDRAQIYELIARRFLATVGPEGRGRGRSAELTVGGEPFKADGFHLLDPGWYKIYPYMRPPDEVELPVLAPEAKVPLERVYTTEEKTLPPRRFGQGSLVQEMEKLGLGTKSTRHEVIQKLLDRHYIQARGLEPTTSGVAVTDALRAHASFVTKPDMTAQLEKEMDSIAQGTKPLKDVVEESRSMLREVYDVLQKNAPGIRATLTSALDAQHFVGPCPKCGGSLSMRRSQKGSRWVQCANNPATCTASYALPAAGFIEPSPELCTLCKTPKVRITFRGQRPALYCIEPLCEEHKKAFQIGTCSSCGRPLNIRYSFKGNRFVGCSGWPQCKVSYPLPQRGHLDKDHAPCEVCRAPIVTAVEKGRPPWTLCINPECPTRKGASPYAPHPAAKPVPGVSTTEAAAAAPLSSAPIPASVPAPASAPSSAPGTATATAKPRKARAPAKPRAPRAAPATSSPSGRKRSAGKAATMASEGAEATEEAAPATARGRGRSKRTNGEATASGN